jgi:Putative MetA-pathway of phenol degradation
MQVLFLRRAVLEAKSHSSNPARERSLLWATMAVIVVIACSASAQELEPRAYSPSPVGTGFLVFGFARSSGGVTLDPTIPVTNVKGTFNSPVVGLGQTFGLLGRQSLITASLPYAWGRVSGQVGEQSGSITRSGIANTKLRFSVNLHGVPAMDPRQFAATPHRDIIVAVSLTVDAPSGQYDKTKLINLGTNRWAFKPELGLSCPFRKFYFDLYASASLFTENANFYPGNSTRTQDTLSAIQAHVSYAIRPRLWAAFDATWYGGGAVRLNGGLPSQRQSNSRLGATVSLPLAKQQSLKVSYSSGVSARVGANFRTLAVSWQYVWFEKH